jgi:peroxin-3
MGSSPPSATDDDGKSIMSLQSESGIHASQMGVPSAVASGDGPQDGGQQAHKAKKSKLQLWNNLKISGMYSPNLQVVSSTLTST